MTHPSQSSGLITSYQSNFYTVLTEHQQYTCFLKGMLKKHATDVLVGDRVMLDSLDEANATGRIVEVLPRSSQLLRPKIANITHAVIVASLKSPAFQWEQVDRYLAHIQLADITPIICISKSDLGSPEEIEAIKQCYQESLGVPVFETSTHDVASVHAFFEALTGKTLVLAGLSGVGKSSLLNTFQPTLQLSTGAVSQKIQRGQHTTRSVTLLELPNNTFVADTPGFSHLTFEETDPQHLEGIFTDFAPFRDQCRFDNCRHADEADCAVVENLSQLIDTRYASYRTFLKEAQAFVAARQTSSRKEAYGYKTLQRGREKDVKILRLNDKQRAEARNTQKQRHKHQWEPFEDDTLEE